MLNFYISGGIYSLFMAILFGLRVFARNLLRRCRRRNIFILISNLNPDFMSNKPTHYLLDYGDCFYVHSFVSLQNLFATPKSICAYRTICSHQFLIFLSKFLFIEGIGFANYTLHFTGLPLCNIIYRKGDLLGIIFFLLFCSFAFSAI